MYADHDVIGYITFVGMMLLFGIMILLLYGVYRCMRIILYNFRKKSVLSVDYTQSQLSQGGRIVFKANLNVWLARGFIKSKIRSPFGDMQEFSSYYDKDTGFLAMEKWTGYHASMVMQHIVSGKVQKGAIPIEKAMSGIDFYDYAKKRNYSIKIF